MTLVMWHYVLNKKWRGASKFPAQEIIHVMPGGGFPFETLEVAQDDGTIARYSVMVEDHTNKVAIFQEV